VPLSQRLMSHPGRARADTPSSILDTAVEVAEHATDKLIKRNKCQVLTPLSVAVNVAGVFASTLLLMPLHSRLPRSNK